MNEITMHAKVEDGLWMHVTNVWITTVDHMDTMGAYGNWEIS